MAQAEQRVGEYVLEVKVGGGTFGEVWRAHHHVWLDQLVAIKIPTDPQYLRNLQREGAAIHGLVHPNIVRAMGFDPYAEVPYLTMEFIPLAAADRKKIHVDCGCGGDYEAGFGRPAICPRAQHHPPRHQT
jgi:serine/threonine protein kinase